MLSGTGGSPIYRPVAPLTTGEGSPLLRPRKLVQHSEKEREVFDDLVQKFNHNLAEHEKNARGGNDHFERDGIGIANNGLSFGRSKSLDLDQAFDELLDSTRLEVPRSARGLHSTPPQENSLSMPQKKVHYPDDFLKNSGGENQFESVRKGGESAMDNRNNNEDGHDGIKYYDALEKLADLEAMPSPSDYRASLNYNRSSSRWETTEGSYLMPFWSDRSSWWSGTSPLSSSSNAVQPSSSGASGRTSGRSSSSSSASTPLPQDTTASSTTSPNGPSVSKWDFWQKLRPSALFARCTAPGGSAAASVASSSKGGDFQFLWQSDFFSARRAEEVETAENPSAFLSQLQRNKRVRNQRVRKSLSDRREEKQKRRGKDSEQGGATEMSQSRSQSSSKKVGRSNSSQVVSGPGAGGPGGVNNKNQSNGPPTGNVDNVPNGNDNVVNVVNVHSGANPSGANLAAKTKTKTNSNTKSNSNSNAFDPNHLGLVDDATGSYSDHDTSSSSLFDTDEFEPRGKGGGRDPKRTSLL